MIGNGVDMYDLVKIPIEQDKELYLTDEKFWVGVLEGIYPSPPVPRKRTKCFSPRPVYIYNGLKIFKGSDDCFYKIPENETKWIQ